MALCRQLGLECMTLAEPALSIPASGTLSTDAASAGKLQELWSESLRLAHKVLAEKADQASAEHPGESLLI